MNSPSSMAPPKAVSGSVVGSGCLRSEFVHTVQGKLDGGWMSGSLDLYQLWSACNQLGGCAAVVDGGRWDDVANVVNRSRQIRKKRPFDAAFLQEVYRQHLKPLEADLAPLLRSHATAISTDPSAQLKEEPQPDRPAVPADAAGPLLEAAPEGTASALGQGERVEGKAAVKKEPEPSQGAAAEGASKDEAAAQAGLGRHGQADLAQAAVREGKPQQEAAVAVAAAAPPEGEDAASKSSRARRQRCCNLPSSLSARERSAPVKLVGRASSAYSDDEVEASVMWVRQMATCVATGEPEDVSGEGDAKDGGACGAWSPLDEDMLRSFAGGLVRCRAIMSRPAQEAKAKANAEAAAEKKRTVEAAFTAGVRRTARKTNQTRIFSPSNCGAGGDFCGPAPMSMSKKLEIRRGYQAAVPPYRWPLPPPSDELKRNCDVAYLRPAEPHRLAAAAQVDEEAAAAAAAVPPCMAVPSSKDDDLSHLVSFEPRTQTPGSQTGRKDASGSGGECQTTVRMVRHLSGAGGEGPSAAAVHWRPELPSSQGQQRVLQTRASHRLHARVQKPLPPAAPAAPAAPAVPAAPAAPTAAAAPEQAAPQGVSSSHAADGGPAAGGAAAAAAAAAAAVLPTVMQMSNKLVEQMKAGTLTAESLAAATAALQAALPAANWQAVVQQLMSQMPHLAVLAEAPLPQQKAVRSSSRGSARLADGRGAGAGGGGSATMNQMMTLLSQAMPQAMPAERLQMLVKQALQLAPAAAQPQPARRKADARAASQPVASTSPTAAAAAVPTADGKRKRGLLYEGVPRSMDQVKRQELVRKYMEGQIRKCPELAEEMGITQETPERVLALWNEADQAAFRKGIMDRGRDFLTIQEELLAHRSVHEVVVFYYTIWKTGAVPAAQRWALERSDHKTALALMLEEEAAAAAESELSQDEVEVRPRPRKRPPPRCRDPKPAMPPAAKPLDKPAADAAGKPAGAKTAKAPPRSRGGSKAPAPAPKPAAETDSSDDEDDEPLAAKAAKRGLAIAGRSSAAGKEKSSSAAASRASSSGPAATALQSSGRGAAAPPAGAVPAEASTAAASGGEGPAACPQASCSERPGPAVREPATDQQPAAAAVSRLAAPAAAPHPAPGQQAGQQHFAAASSPPAPACLPPPSAMETHLQTAQERAAAAATTPAQPSGSTAAEEHARAAHSTAAGALPPASADAGAADEQQQQQQQQLHGQPWPLGTSGGSHRPAGLTAP